MPSIHTRTLAAGAVLLSTLITATAADRPAPAKSLSALDYAEIQQLVNRLSFALDYCTRSGKDFAELFAPGGRFIIDDGSGSPRIYDTPEALVKLAGGPDCTALKNPPRSYIAHLSASLVIEPSANGATGKSYAIYPARNGKYFREDTAGQVGIYQDVYVKTSQGWKFQSRQHVLQP
jgi:hypothetical protein